jgi:hypothetical protein
MSSNSNLIKNIKPNIYIYIFIIIFFKKKKKTKTITTLPPLSRETQLHLAYVISLLNPYNSLVDE